MDNVSVSLDDIDALAQALGSGVLPAADLLQSIITAIRTVADGEDSVTVGVEVVGPLRQTFDAAFTPDPAPGDPVRGQRVHVTVNKITR